MKINNIPVTQLKDNAVDEDGNPEMDGDKPVTNIDKLLQSYMSTGGLTLTLASGSGVYSDVADFCGNYTATISIPEITYGITVKNVPATMVTASTITPYLTQADTYVRNDVGAPDGGNSDVLPITDYYGYIIDLAFRTNAADSYLRLQTKGIDRIYNGNEQNPETMGGGSTMTFKSKDVTTFPNAKVEALMQHIKVVFFDPTEQNTILAYGKLSGTARTDMENNVTMDLVLADASGAAVENLMALEQNTAHRVSVLVYLDGTQVDNADVAYSSAASMEGKLNLQFCSSATLVPMEYSDLRTGANNGTGGTTPSTPATSDVTTTITTGYAATAKYIEGVGIAAVITETTGNTPVTTGTVTIDSKTATYQSVGTYSAWVVTADAAPAGSVAITVA